MGQSSSTSSKTALPSTNLLIDASDSYVTDVKLRSTAIIPISEYIKKDKYKRTKKSLLEVKENKNGKKGKLETIDEEIKNESDTKHDDKNKKQNEEKQRRIIEDIKKEKKQFIESSYEDIADKRKWVHVHSPPKHHQTYNGKNVRNRKTQTKIHRSHNKVPSDREEDSHISQNTKEIDLKPTSTEQLRQIYKNEVYPHVYKNRYKRRKEKRVEEQKKIEEEQKKEEQKKEEQKKKETELAPVSTKTDVNKIPNKKEESTHNITQHHFKRFAQFFKKPKHNNLVVQTNISCVIHPNKKQRFSPTSSEEIIRNPVNGTTKRYLSKLLRKDEETKKYNIYESSSNTSSPIIQRKTDKINKVTEEHRKYLSAKQALSNWKNIHTLRQHRKQSQPNYETPTEENYKTDNRNPYTYTEERYNEEYNPSMEYIVPPRRHRSRAGYRQASRSDIVRMDRKMTPLEISNYNYTKMPPQVKMEYIPPEEIKERYHNQRMRYQNPRDYERPDTPRYEYIESSSYNRFPQHPRYPDYPSKCDVRPKSSPKNDRHYRKNPLPEIPEKEERKINKSDFIADMERCLQKHQKMASKYNRAQTPNKSTWVQDKHRRWHKVVME